MNHAVDEHTKERMVYALLGHMAVRNESSLSAIRLRVKVMVRVLCIFLFIFLLCENDRFQALNPPFLSFSIFIIFSSFAMLETWQILEKDGLRKGLKIPVENLLHIQSTDCCVYFTIEK